MSELDITFLGAARTVTGSMHLLRVGTQRLLIDAGMFQGRRAEADAKNRNPPRVALGAGAMVLTHAHIDHAGNLPVVVKRGFAGKVHCTAATADLCQAMLRDSARIQVADAEWLNRKNAKDPDWVELQPLYDEDDAEAAIERLVPHAYAEPFEPLPGVRCTFLDAGHILGSASVVCDILAGERAGTRVCFSGDIGRQHLPILRDPTPPERPDVVVMESTYGNRLHAPAEGMLDQLEQAIESTRKRGGKVIIPSFALERTQELVYAIHQLLRARRIQPLPVIVDSPLAVDLTEVFRRHPDCYDEETAEFLRHGDPFGFASLQMVESVEESKALNQLDKPAVIIAASGMCEFGRIVHHLKNSIENPKNTVLIVGFQAPHTLGRRLVERRETVRIFGVEREVRAEVRVLNAFSAHADRDELLWWAERCGPQLRQIFLVHGEPEQSEALARELRSRGRDVVVPEPASIHPL